MTTQSVLKVIQTSPPCLLIHYVSLCSFRVEFRNYRLSFGRDCIPLLYFVFQTFFSSSYLIVSSRKSTFVCIYVCKLLTLKKEWLYQRQVQLFRLTFYFIVCQYRRNAIKCPLLNVFFLSFYHILQFFLFYFRTSDDIGIKELFS